MKIKVEFKNENAKSEFLVKGNKGDAVYNAMIAAQIDANASTAHHIGDFIDFDAVNEKSGMNFFIQEFDFDFFNFIEI